MHGRYPVPSLLCNSKHFSLRALMYSILTQRPASLKGNTFTSTFVPNVKSVKTTPLWHVTRNTIVKPHGIMFFDWKFLKEQFQEWILDLSFLGLNQWLIIYLTDVKARLLTWTLKLSIFRTFEPKPIKLGSHIYDMVDSNLQFCYHDNKVTWLFGGHIG